MSLLSVETIPTRNWSDTQIDLVVERDNLRKKSQLSVDERIHYLWFHYLKLCMNLEQIGYRVVKKDSGRRIIEETEVKVNNYIYIDWSLNSLYDMKFYNWYGDNQNIDFFSLRGVLNMVGGQDTIHWSRGIMFSLNTRIGNLVTMIRICRCVRILLRCIRRNDFYSWRKMTQEVKKRVCSIPLF